MNLIGSLIDSTNIDVSVDDGIVTLRGTVTTYYEKFSAEDASFRVLGVRTVINEIDVDLTSAFRRTDEKLHEAVIDELTWDITVPEDRITVTVVDGFVTLNGTVDWNYQKLNATDDVSYLAGVKGITNNIKVEPTVTFDRPAEQIERALERSGLVDRERIEISIQGNKAILDGKVPTWSERREAERLEWSTPGVFEGRKQYYCRLQAVKNSIFRANV